MRKVCAHVQPYDLPSYLIFWSTLRCCFKYMDPSFSVKIVIFLCFFPRNPRWVCVAWLMFSQRRHLHGWCPSWRSCRQGSNNRSRTSSNNKKCHQRQIVQRRTSCALCGCGWKTQREREKERRSVSSNALKSCCLKCCMYSMFCTLIYSYHCTLIQWPPVTIYPLRFSILSFRSNQELMMRIMQEGCVCVKGRPRGVQPRVYLLVIGREKWKDLFFWGLKL